MQSQLRWLLLQLLLEVQLRRQWQNISHRDSAVAVQ